MRLTKIKENYEQSVKNIELLLDGSIPELTDFFEWLNTTEINPFSFLPEQYSYAFDTAEGFEGLLNAICHAVLDDGEICLIKTFLGYKIVFLDHFEEKFKEWVYNLIFPSKTPHTPSLDEFEFEIISKNRIHEWGQLIDEHFIESIKESFVMDVGRNGEEFAVEHYRKYRFFDVNWLVTEKDQINEWKFWYNVQLKNLIGENNESR